MKCYGCWTRNKGGTQTVIKKGNICIPCLEQQTISSLMEENFAGQKSRD